MQVGTSARRIVAPIAVLLQLTACAAPYSLPPSVQTPVGQSPKLTCASGEIQMCRDAGHALRCSCTIGYPPTIAIR